MLIWKYVQFTETLDAEFHTVITIYLNKIQRNRIYANINMTITKNNYIYWKYW